MLSNQQSETIRHSLLYWILRIAIGVNLSFYLCEIVIKLIYELLYPEGPISLQNIFLGTSKNWALFVNVRIFMLAIGLLGAVIAWRVEPYWRRTDNI
jgi:hypothetical protein